MAIVIGAATQVSFGNACVVSANWGANPNVQRLYCIGEWAPRENMTFEKPIETLSLTIYSPGPSYDVSPTESCTDANTISASISPAACGETFNALSGDWFVTSYSFTKDDPLIPSQESWSMQRWVQGGNNTPLPSYVLRGISEGQGTDNAGITFVGATTTSFTGNVSAGGMGKAETIEMGVVSNIGGGTTQQGETGQGSVSMPYTPLWL